MRFIEHLVADGFNYAFGLSAADLTGNGVVDLVVADTEVGIAWYENDGDGCFTPHVIDARSDEWLERHAVVDIDGDGRPEIVVVDNINGSVLYFEFDGDPRRRDAWRRRYLCEGTLPGAYDVAVADFDGDGRLDVAASSWRKGNRFDWFQQLPEGGWAQHTIDSDLPETRTVRVADFDGDGRPDLLGTATEGAQMMWYRNPGGLSEPWEKHVIDSHPRPVHGHPVDMDGDGGVDVVMALGMHVQEGSPTEGHQVAWYEADPDNGWRKHIICEHFPGAFEAVAGDLDGDGRVEVAASSWGEGRVAIFRHDGDPRGRWTMQLLTEDWPRVSQVVLADLTGTGQLDIVAAAERGSNEVRRWTLL